MQEDAYWLRRTVARRRLLATSSAGAAAIGIGLATGCGDDDDEKTGAEQAGTPAAAQPKRGGHLVWAHNTGDQPNQDIHFQPTTASSAYGSGLVYSRLLRRKVGPGIGTIASIPEGDLAASWEQPDERTYIFKLRPNVKWQNIAPVNGRALVAEDLIYSFGRQLQLRFAAGFLPQTDRIEAVDPLTLRMQSTRPDADFLDTLSFITNKIVSREAVELKGDLKDGPNIGTGPWIFEQWVPNNTIKFKRNPDYYRKDEAGNQLPYADSLELLRILDPSTLLAAFRTGKLLHYTPTKGEADQLMKENPKYQRLLLKYSGAVTGNAVVLATDRPPMNDIRVRRAVNMAINRKEWKDVIDNGEGWKAGMMLTASNEDQLLPDEEIDKLLVFDPAGARRLLQEAGVTNWTPKIFSFHTNAAPAELAQRYLAQVGINGTIETRDSPGLGRYFSQHDGEVVPFIRGPQSTGVNSDFRAGYKTGGLFNTSKLSDPEIDRLIEDQAAELKDVKRRNQIIHQILRRVIDLQAVVPINGSLRHVVIQPHVRNVFQSYPTSPEAGAYELMWLDQ